MPSFRYEISLGRKSDAVICGIDDAGLRSLAGPVVACAAILPLSNISTRLLGALDDSKRLSPEVREEVAAKLRVKAIYAIAEASAEAIDRRLNRINSPRNRIPGWPASRRRVDPRIP